MENFLIYLYKYFWVILILIIFVLLVLMLILNIIQKRRLVKSEKNKQSTLLQMSYEDDKKNATAKHIDGETPKNKKYCPLCHALVDKKMTACPVCGNQFKKID